MIIIYHNYIRPNYHISIFENMGVLVSKLHPLYDIALRAPLVKFSKITPGVAGTGGHVPLPLFTNLYTKCPFAAYTTHVDFFEFPTMAKH